MKMKCHSNMLTLKEREKRINELLKLKEKATTSEERNKIQSKIYELKNYEKRLEIAKKSRAKRRQEGKIRRGKKEQIDVRALTPIEREVLEIKRREHPMVFKPNKNTKYIIGERMVIRKCDKCGKELDDCYSTFKLMEENKYYCENCKTSEMYKLGL